MKWPCIIDAVVLTAFVIACIWEWRRDVNAKARAELKELTLSKAKVVNPYVTKASYNARLETLAQMMEHGPISANVGLALAIRIRGMKLL